MTVENQGQDAASQLSIEQTLVYACELSQTGLVSPRNSRSSWEGYNLWESREDSSQEGATDDACLKALN